ncbi:hypothetical protein MCEMIH16_00567 [Caulobacteraceae bacterium]
MSGVKSTLAITASILALATAGAATAQASGPAATAPTTKAEVSAGVTGAAKIETAYRLAAYGREKSDPQALILSAKMLNEVGAQAGDLTGATTTGGVADSAAKKAKPEIAPALLLDEAEALARGNEAVLTQIAEVRASAQKGFIGGVRRSVIRLQARSVWTWTGTAVAGQPAIAIAQGDGDTDIDMKVYDGSGNLICQDTLNDYTPACRWTPAWTGRFTLQLINNGGVYSDTVLVTN